MLNVQLYSLYTVAYTVDCVSSLSRKFRHVAEYDWLPIIIMRILSRMRIDPADRSLRLPEGGPICQLQEECISHNSRKCAELKIGRTQTPI